LRFEVELASHRLSAIAKLLVITGSNARSATCRYLSYSEADFEVFAPQGPHVAPMGVKYGMEKGTGPVLHAKFHPHRCNNEGIGPPKLTFLLKFDQNVEYKRLAGAYPLRDFHKICRVLPHFMMH